MNNNFVKESRIITEKGKNVPVLYCFDKKIEYNRYKITGRSREHASARLFERMKNRAMIETYENGRENKR